MYTREDARFFLENYNNLKLECDEFLLYSWQPGNKSEIASQKTGRENERNIIKKLDNKTYQENKYIIKCVDTFLKSLDPESYRIVYAKYFYRMKNYDIATKYYIHISTLKRKLKVLLDDFLRILNNF
ncbi:hypothetical protein AXE85_05675 [Gemella sp. oral taxon 928]|uniref:hypothetical protein n=1 Tax=Gemella sp. oral taxon 928 TaxID=1785995 RepID=UPI000768164A|nr:hypothetical protein [Gemella sp. oral taxon 928]AME09675.1 hypothetical protein AXE85_05675 [Gemella sp. oral taxon 928]